MRELRVQVNYRSDADSNISLAFTHLIDNDADVEALGEEDAETLNRYVTGFGRWAQEHQA